MDMFTRQLPVLVCLVIVTVHNVIGQLTNRPKFTPLTPKTWKVVSPSKNKITYNKHRVKGSEEPSFSSFVVQIGLSKHQAANARQPEIRLRSQAIQTQNSMSIADVALLLGDYVMVLSYAIF